MSQQSTIEWCDATWNPVRGCEKVSPGCANCYAETFAERWRGVKGHPYEQGFDLRLVPHKLMEPLKWKEPQRIFVNSMSDLFQDGVPDSYIDQVFAVMALAPQHTFQVLTKRAERMRAYLSAGNRHKAIVAAMDMPQWLPSGRRFLRVPENWPMPNVWLGVSVENQHFADERIPLLLETPAAVRFISAEPLLEEIVVKNFLDPPSVFAAHADVAADALMVTTDEAEAAKRSYTRLDLVIAGGESGHGARACYVAWVRSLLEQCQVAGVAFFAKQLGSRCMDYSFDHRSWPQGTRAHVGATMGAARWIQLSKKGGVMEEWPEDLRVRQLPGQ